jgi:predicted Zn finger-like uncharacterized protein
LRDALAQEQYTRCPGCKTIFRVTQQQLAMRAGQVRCGHCKTVFDGAAHLISLAPRPRPEADAPYDEAALGPPTVTLRSSLALEPSGDEPTGGEPAAARVADAPDTIGGGGTDPMREIAYEERFAPPRHRRSSPIASALLVAAVPLLLLALGAQAALHWRDVLGAHFPATRPLLAGACAAFGCSVRPLRDIAGLSIEASDLQADPAHRGLLILSATLRNRAAWPLAFPHLELTLTDGQDQPVVRRALAPSEYAGGTIDVATGMPGNGEAAIKLFIDASATTQSGYRLYMFYP